MTIKVISEQQVFQEAVQVLLEHLSLAKVVRFWAAWQIGEGDYLALRDQIFSEESVATLFEKVQDYQEAQEKVVPGT
jgi:hypothetical protein